MWLKDRRSVTEQNYSKIIVHLRHVILEDLNLRKKLTYAVSYEMPWGIFGKFIEKLFKGIGERQLEKTLEKLKSILEK